MPYLRVKLYHFFLWTYAACVAMLFHSKVHAQPAMQQDKAVADNAIFYKVTGNGLQSPSYLFGTFHLLTQSYVDSLHEVMQKFGTCKQMVGEMIVDSSMAMKMAPATMLKGTTLDKVLDKDLYDKTAKWLKELSGYDLSLFNSVNPMTINVTLLQLVQAKYFPNPKGEDAMDIYFQKTAKKRGMKVMGFESMDVQIEALFNQFTVQRQAQLLADFVNRKDSSVIEMKEMIAMYRKHQLSELDKLMYDETYKPEEVKVMVTDRNNSWIAKLPGMMNDAPTFVAVGALHLAGENGLVQQLRKEGYTVEPISLN